MTASETQKEDDCITLDLIDTLSGQILDKACDWSNKFIFEPLGGKLSITMPLATSVNAGAKVLLSKPLNPEIIINMGMIHEIYRDCLTFPVYTEKVHQTTDTFSNESWDSFKETSFKFESGIPSIVPEDLSPITKVYADTWLRVAEDKLEKQLKDVKHEVLRKTVPARFHMFEMMLLWVFFHELSHLIQCHYKLKDKSTDRIVFYEIETVSDVQDLKGQAREILADIEGLDLTLQYLNRENLNTPNSFYLLLCSITCMFNRFYTGKYETNLNAVKGSHPHPVIRNEYLHLFFCKKMGIETPYVWKTEVRESILRGYAYLTVKSSLSASLFWSNRHEGFKGEQYPSYMAVQMKMKSKEGVEYRKNMGDSILSQIDTILEHHLQKNTILKTMKDNTFFENV
ncbi:hypothetical protein [Psychromonas arctica]|uniref:hypothetical protein n=1 Tax=Psychromonas arctica TaxID=168275 RepID=UPI000422CD0B|nr:hypothetical protein [Psychromonas arctica]